MEITVNGQRDDSWGDVPDDVKRLVDGQTYDSVESLPPEIRERLRGLIPQSGGTPAEGAAPAAPDRALAEGEILLNGVPTRVHSDPPRKKRWWQRGS